ncbi:Hsp20/alpha crystallin family protein [Candidatus Nomurabacteria bacterium]|nr:Hsp20/alpha crystallin family protein [Candidatus Nomurabacteria bacterium]
MDKNKKRSFWERLTGSVHEDEYEEVKKTAAREKVSRESREKKHDWIEEEAEEAELAVDVYQTGTDIVVQTFVAGVKPEDLELSIGRDMIVIKGHREESRNIDEEDYFSEELYWGKFSRTISLPVEVEPEEVEATEKHGLLTVKIKKVDKDRKNSVRIKSI